MGLAASRAEVPTALQFLERGGGPGFLPVPAALLGNTTGTTRGGVSAPEAEARDPREKKVVPVRGPFDWACLGWVCVRRKRLTAQSSNAPKLGHDVERFEQDWEGCEWDGDK